MKRNIEMTEVYVVNWNKYNSNASKRNKWFKMNGDFIFSLKHSHLSRDEKFLFIAFLSLATKQGPLLSFSVKSFSSLLGFKPYYFKKLLSSLLANGYLSQDFSVLKPKSVPERNENGTKTEPTCQKSILRGDSEKKKCLENQAVSSTLVLEENRIEENRIESASAQVVVDNSLNRKPKLHFLAELWNEHCGKLSKCSSTQGKREKEARLRWKNNPDEKYWTEVARKLAGSPFCNGKNDRGWRADFDFFISPEGHAKAFEGKYDPRGAPTEKDKAENEEFTRRALANAGR